MLRTQVVDPPDRCELGVEEGVVLAEELGLAHAERALEGLVGEQVATGEVLDVDERLAVGDDPPEHQVTGVTITLGEAPPRAVDRLSDEVQRCARRISDQ